MFLQLFSFVNNSFLLNLPSSIFKKNSIFECSGKKSDALSISLNNNVFDLISEKFKDLFAALSARSFPRMPI